MQDHCHSKYVADIEDKLSANSKCFFSYTKSLKASNSLPNAVVYNGISASTKESVSDLFADYFSSVYQKPDSERTTKVRIATDFNMAPITSEGVKRILAKLDQYKVSSPDNVPAIFYKKLCSSICIPMAIIFNKSLIEGKYPTPWKVSFISPTFKTGNRSKAENYRPISILCAIIYMTTSENLSIHRNMALFPAVQRKRTYWNMSTLWWNQLQMADKSTQSSQISLKRSIKRLTICYCKT